MPDLTSLQIPVDLLPRDGRFGAGPSRIRPQQVDALAAAGSTVLGTSHRQPPVKNLVRQIREGLAELFALPGDYEVVLGNGGSTAFWDAAAFGLIEQRAQHVVIGEFSSKFAAETANAPHLAAPAVLRGEPGTRVLPQADAAVDVYAYPHNETSTGVMLPVERPQGATAEQLVLVDATSAAGGATIDVTQADAYYFAPQKAFSSDGGLWIALLSPAAIERTARIAATSRWIPEFLSLTAAIDNSRKNQTLNTPAIATLLMMAEQIEWMLGQGGLAWADQRTRATSGAVYAWAESRPETAPFVTDSAARSQVVATVDVDERIDATQVTTLLRAHGVVDIEPYRKLGRNQLRIATFPSVPVADVEALLAVLDHVLDAAG